MYWFIRKEEPIDILDRVNEQHKSGEWEKIPEQERLEIVKQLDAWDKARGKFYYRAGEKALRYFMELRFIKWIFGGNRSGKTVVNAMDVVMQCEGWHPLQRTNLEVLAKDGREKWVRDLAKKYLKEKKWLKAPPVSARCVAVDFTNGVEKFAGPAIRDWATRSEIEYDGIDNEKRRLFKWKNGSKLEFMSQEQPVLAHGGTARDIVWFDEECSSPIYQENLMRVINGGRILGGMTAIEGTTWTQDKIWDKAHKKGDKDIYAVKFSTYDNPILGKRAIQRIIDQCVTEEDIQIRIHGGFIARGGNVWKEYRDRPPWIVEPFELPEDHGYLIACADTHTATPHGVLWAFVDPGIMGEDGKRHGMFHPLIDEKPNVYFVGEVFRGGTISDLVDDMRLVEAGLKREHDYFLLEPHAWSEDQTNENGRSVFQQFIDEDLAPIKASKDLRGGILAVRQTHVCDEQIKDSHPRSMIFRTLERTRWEMVRYRYPHRRGWQKDEKRENDTPLNKDDHMMQNLRRIVEFVVDEDFEMVDQEEKVPPVYMGGHRSDVFFEDEKNEFGGIEDVFLGE